MRAKSSERVDTFTTGTIGKPAGLPWSVVCTITWAPPAARPVTANASDSGVSLRQRPFFEGGAPDQSRAAPTIAPSSGKITVAPCAIGQSAHAPQAVTTDGHHVVATFAASSEGSFRLVAVPIDDVAAVDASEMTAGK